MRNYQASDIRVGQVWHDPQDPNDAWDIIILGFEDNEVVWRFKAVGVGEPVSKVGTRILLNHWLNPDKYELINFKNFNTHKLYEKLNGEA